jgi:hypothetical protein
VTLESVVACCCSPPAVTCCAFTSVLGAYAAFEPLSVNGLDMGDGTYLQTGRLNPFTQEIIPGSISISTDVLAQRTMPRAFPPGGRCGYRFQLSTAQSFGWVTTGSNNFGFLLRIQSDTGAILGGYGGRARLEGSTFRAWHWICPFRFTGGTWHYEIGLEIGGLAVGAIAPYPNNGCPNGLSFAPGNPASLNAYRGCARPIPAGDTWGLMGASTAEWFRPWPSVSLSASVT